MWDNGRAIIDYLFLSEESSESTVEYAQSYPFFGLVVADELEV